MKRLLIILALYLLSLSSGNLSPCHAQSGVTVQQSSTSRKILFLLVQSADHLTGLPGATPTVTISKNGGAFAAPAGTVAELANGWYVLTPTSADTGAVGPLIIHATAASADPVDIVENVVAYNPDSATNLGLTNLDAAVSSRSTFAGGAVASVTGNVGGSVGSVTGNVGGSVGSVTGAVGSVTGGVTVTTNNDKTGYTVSTVQDKSGYSLAATQNFNNTSTTLPGWWANTTAPGYYTAPANPATVSLSSGDEAKLSNLDAAVSSRLAASAYTAPSNNQTGDAYALLASLLNVGRTAYTSTALANAPTGGGGGLTAPQVAAAVWDEPTAGHTTSGTFAPFLTALPSATLTTIKADSLFALLLHSRKQLYNYVPSTKTLTLLNDDGTSTGLTVTLTVDSGGQITSRH